MNLGDLLQYCVAQDVVIEFKNGGPTPGSITIQAFEGNANLPLCFTFSRSYTLEEFTQREVAVFTSFLDEARRELLKRRE